MYKFKKLRVLVELKYGSFMFISGSLYLIVIQHFTIACAFVGTPSPEIGTLLAIVLLSRKAKTRTAIFLETEF